MLVALTTIWLESASPRSNMQGRQSVRRREKIIKRVPTLRLLVATLVSIGLVLSPVAAANTMATMPVTVMDGGGNGAITSSPDKPCPCCDMASKCVAATCATTCAQLAGPDLAFQVALVGHIVLTAKVPSMHPGLGWRPPPPPPAVDPSRTISRASTLAMRP